jgi:hypothetical protein
MWRWLSFLITSRLCCFTHALFLTKGLPPPPTQQRVKKIDSEKMRDSERGFKGGLYQERLKSGRDRTGAAHTNNTS